MSANLICGRCNRQAGSLPAPGRVQYAEPDPNRLRGANGGTGDRNRPAPRIELAGQEQGVASGLPPICIRGQRGRLCGLLCGLTAKGERARQYSAKENKQARA